MALRLEANGESSQKEAWLLKDFPDNELSTTFKKWIKLLEREDATLFEHIGVKKLLKPEPLAEFGSDIWLVLDSDLNTQFGILNKFARDKAIPKIPLRFFSPPVQERFHFDFESLLSALLADQRAILQAAARYTDPVVRMACGGAARILFRRPIDEKGLNQFFDQVVDFMRKYDRFELNERTIKKLILSNQAVNL